MAAVLCDSIGYLCTLPCRCCDAVCKGCASLTEIVCSSPFSTLCAVTLLSQIPPIVVGFLEISRIQSGCQASFWLLGVILFGIVNLSAVFYLAIRTGNTKDETLSHLNSTFERASHLLCHDPWIAIYILVFMGYIAYLILGSTWNWSEEFREDFIDEEVCSESVYRNVNIALGCGYFYVVGGFWALILSMCCACCCK